MKKILITISIALFALTSCSSDDSSGSSSSTREKLKENQMKMISSFSESELSDKDKKAYSKYIDCYVDAIYDNLSEDAIKKLKWQSKVL